MAYLSYARGIWNAGGGFKVRTDFLPYISQAPVSGYFVPGPRKLSLKYSLLTGRPSLCYNVEV